MMQELLFIVDDDPHFRGLMTTLLEDRGYTVKALESGEHCLEMLDEEPAVIFLDVIMAGIDGVETLKRIKAQREEIPVIMLTSVDDIETAINLVRLGAYNYIVKPFDEARLFTELEKAIQQRTLVSRIKHLQADLNKLTLRDGIVGKSQAVKKVLDQMSKVQTSKAGVLIEGESGTGKELVARAIHRNSPYAEGLFIDINCAAIPETLQENELFGHKKGAFTGATETRKGKLELANGGTLFLDEVAEMSLQTQAKLLRFLQEKNFELLGDSKKIQVDTRVIAATNKDLKALVAKGTFREDLYFRLQVFPIRVPPLRQRKEDIPLLCAHFIKKYREELSKNVQSISNEALEVLLQYPWPGNIRQLENAIYRAMIITSYDSIDIDCLPEDLLDENQEMAAPPTDKKETLPASKPAAHITPFHETVKQSLKSALTETDHNIPQAAKELGISRSTFYRMLKRYGLN